MKRTTVRRTGIAAAVLALSLPLAACGSDSDDSTANDDTTGSSMTSESPSSEMTDEASPEMTDGAAGTAMDAAAQTFGEGCALIPADGAGSFNGMATAPVATAASANPLLKTLVAAVTEAGLGDTLNSAKDITVFAPTDDAFAKIPAGTLKKVMADKDQLTKILTHHVVEGKLAPEALAGEHKTLNGDMVNVMGAKPTFTVGDEKAKVLCGNIPTANATVYVVDTVLMP